MTEQRGTESPGEGSFRQLVEAAPDALVVSRDGVLLYVNPAAVALLGFERAEELVGQPMSLFLEEPAVRTMRERLAHARRTGEKLQPLEYPARRRDGTRLVAELSSMLTLWDGQPAVVAFARDVTERVRLRAQLAQSERLAALGTLSAGLAHEINNPLAFVQLTAQLLERRLGADEHPLTSYARDLLGGVERVVRIVRSLGVYARGGDEPLEPVELALVVDAAHSLVAHELVGRVRYEREVQGSPRARATATRLEQVLVNLLLNALAAFDEGRADAWIAVRAREQGERVVLEVEDNGRGIPPADLERIFEPFYTTRRGGTGLGLAICRDLVRGLRGELEVTSEPGKGSRFRVSVPKA